MSNKGCALCPRECGADRSCTAGYCGADNSVRVAKAYAHMWEEPCISGKNGSGCVFFTGCQLGCVFCQNYEISHVCKGREISVDRLGEIILQLQSSGVHNINLVTPTPYTDSIITVLDALGDELNIPVVWNCGGYEKTLTIERLSGYVDIYMPDIKYMDNKAAGAYLNAPDYYETAVSALSQMLKQTGKPSFDSDDMMKSGVIVRHLVMPGHYRDSIAILEDLSARFGTDSFLLSLMSQYIPCGEAANFAEINRRTTTFEYEKVCDRAAQLGFEGYSQQRDSADSNYIPNFDFEGV